MNDFDLWFNSLSLPEQEEYVRDKEMSYWESFYKDYPENWY